MNWLDYAIIAVIALSTVISLMRGFVKEAISLAVWFAALFIASQFYADLAVYFTKINDELIRNGAAIAVLFVVTLILGALVNHVIGQLVQATGLSGTDRALGAVFGGLRGILIASALSLQPVSDNPDNDALLSVIKRYKSHREVYLREGPAQQNVRRNALQ